MMMNIILTLPGGVVSVLYLELNTWSVILLVMMDGMNILFSH